MQFGLGACTMLLLAGCGAPPAGAAGVARSVAPAEPISKREAVAEIETNCRNLFEAVAQIPRELASPEGRATYARGLLDLVGDAITLTDRTRVPAGDRGVVRRVRSQLRAAELILAGAQRTAAQHDLSKAEEHLRRASVVLVEYGAAACLPPPRTSPPAPSPGDAGTRIQLPPTAVISVGPIGVDNNRIAAGDGAVWVGLKNGNAVVRIDPKENRVVASVPIGQSPAGQLTLAEGYLWTFGDAGLVRVDPRTNRVDRRIPRSVLRLEPTDRVWVTRDAIWSCNRATGFVRRSEPVKGRLVAEIPLPTSCFELTVDRSTVWVGGANFTGDRSFVYRIDARTNRLTGSVEVPQGGHIPIPARGGVWIDTRAGAYQVAGDPLAVIGIAPRSAQDDAFVTAFGAGAFWSTRESEQLVLRIDADSLAVEEFRAGPGVNALAVADGVLWASNSDDGTVMRFDVEPWVGGDGG